MSFISAKLPFQFSEEKLRKDFEICRSEEFSEHYNTKDYSGSWKVIALRSPDGTHKNIDANSIYGGFADTELLNRCRYFREVLAKFECEKASVRLLNLSAGSVIKEHKDLGLGYEDGIFRIHIPIITNTRVRFYFEDNRFLMRAGESWYGNFNISHRVENKGETDRIHLVMDCLRNEWSDKLFAQLGYPFKEEGVIEYDNETKRSIISQLKNLDLPAAREQIRRLEAELNMDTTDVQKNK